MRSVHALPLFGDFKRGGRETGSAVEVRAFRVHLPSVTDRDRFGDFVGGNDDGIFIDDLRFRPDVFAVGAGDRETVQFGFDDAEIAVVEFADDEPVADEFKLNGRFTVGKFCANGGRGMENDVFIESRSEGPEGETITDDPFVARVDVVGFAGVHDDGLTRVRDFKAKRLTMAEPRPIARVVRVVGGGGKRSELDPVEREIADPEGFAPFADHGLLLVVVEFAFTGVGAALIPNGAAEAIIFPRGEHSVVHAAAFVPIFGVRASFEELLTDFDRFRNFVPTGVGNPAVNVGTAPVGVDEPDRDVQFFVEPNGEMETAGCAIFLDAVFTNAPAGGGEIFLFFNRDDVIRAIEPDEGIIAGKFLVGTGETRLPPRVKRHFHVRLAAANPDFADENIGEGKGVFPFDNKIAPFKGSRLRREEDLPISGFASGRGRGRSSKLNGYFFTGVGPTPNANRHIALENSAIAKTFRHRDVGAGGRRADGADRRARKNR